PNLLSGAFAPPRLVEARLAGRLRECRNLTALNQKLAAFDFEIVLEKSARRRTRSARAIGIIRATVTRAHQQARLGKPTHRTAKVRAVDGKNLKLVRRNPAEPTRNVAGVAIPRANKRISKSRQPSFTFREFRHRTDRYPGHFVSNHFPF